MEEGSGPVSMFLGIPSLDNRVSFPMELGIVPPTLAPLDISRCVRLDRSPMLKGNVPVIFTFVIDMPRTLLSLPLPHARKDQLVELPPLPPQTVTIGAPLTSHFHPMMAADV